MLRIFWKVISSFFSDFSLFSGYGKILDISLKNKYGFIEFEDKYDAEDACKDLDDTKLCGERVRLEMSKVDFRQIFWCFVLNFKF